jgi:hypothetical protein
MRKSSKKERKQHETEKRELRRQQKETDSVVAGPGEQ